MTIGIYLIFLSVFVLLISRQYAEGSWRVYKNKINNYKVLWGILKQECSLLLNYTKLRSATTVAQIRITPFAKSLCSVCWNVS